MDRNITFQEEFWAGNFGNEYVDRNIGKDLIASNISLFSRALRCTNGISSVLEVGANIGLNLVAIHSLFPNMKISGIEINEKAATILSGLDYVEVFNKSIYDFSLTPNKTWDLVFSKGVLIHQNPEMLQSAYDLLYKASNRYILIVEYYNAVPTEIEYRGHHSVLYKRDFAGEIIDYYPSLKLIDYGFVYHRDNNFPADDLNWFLLQKS